MFKRLAPALWVGLSAALYFTLAGLYPLSDGLQHPRWLWAKQSGVDPRVFIAHLLVFLALFLSFAAAVRHAELIRPGWIWAAFGLSACALLFAFPGESLDIFDYLFRGRMWFEYNRSPLDTPPAALKNFPFHRYVTWSDWVDAYGPLWEYASGAVAALVKLSASPAELAVINNQTCSNQAAVCSYIAKYISGYRLLAIAAVAICGLLIQRTAAPEKRRLALLSFLLNPLTLISSALGAHNDALMLVFVVAGTALAQAPARVWRSACAVLMLLLAAHVKLTALIFVPVLLVWLWRRDGVVKSGIAAISAFCVCAPISWLLYQPLGGWATLGKNIYERSLLSANSLGELIYLYVRFGLGVERYAAQIPTGRAMTALFALIAGITLLVWLLRKRQATLTALSDLGATIAIVFLTVGSFWFQPWYVLWLLGLAALNPTGRFNLRIAPCVAFGVTLAALIADYLRHSNPALLAGWQISVLFVAVLLGSVLVGVFAGQKQTSQIVYRPAA